MKTIELTDDEYDFIRSAIYHYRNLKKMMGFKFTEFGDSIVTSASKKFEYEDKEWVLIN